MSVFMVTVTNTDHLEYMNIYTYINIEIYICRFTSRRE